IQPHQNNYGTYSHRIFELFLRTCSEFEANCKQILLMNNYTKNNKSIEESSDIYRIEDYYKINSACKLHEYIVKIDIGSELLVIKSYVVWNIEKSFKKSKDDKELKYKSLNWYDDYNKVKHDRVNCFKLANLENLLKSISGLQTILFAQFFTSAILKN